MCVVGLKVLQGLTDSEVASLAVRGFPKTSRSPLIVELQPLQLEGSKVKVRRCECVGVCSYPLV